MTAIHGVTEPGYGRVADAFTKNFTLGTEMGAALAIYRHGRLVLDLYAGVADKRSGRLWKQNTLTTVFSATKGLMAICGYMANQRGLLDFDVPVSNYWPEFAQNGKHAATVRDLFSHRAGLISLDIDLNLEDLSNWTPVINAIEQQGPQWDPGTNFAYHALTYGWLTGELLRRITGMRPGQLLANYIADPLKVDAWIGLPQSEEHRVAPCEDAPPTNDPADFALMEKVRSMPAAVRSVTLGVAFPEFGIDGSFSGFNSPLVHAMEIPAANGILTAQALAKIYAATVSDVDGQRLMSDSSVADALIVRSSGEGWFGAMTPPDIRFSTGFMINGYPLRPLLSNSSFGHDGANGGLGFSDVAAEIGFGYVNNQMAKGQDDRANRLTIALRDCLDG
ncbi:MAG TPA: serine hydrolase domain-containing protein [Acidimicrobiales bacterium]